MKILLAVDGSAHSLRAAKYLVKHTREFGGRPAVTCVYVDPPLLQWGSVPYPAAEVARFHAANAAKALRATRNLLSKARVAFDERELVGEASASIAQLAAKGRFDLVVMGSHGRGEMKNLLLGSVVSRTLALTRVPVLVVR